MSKERELLARIEDYAYERLPFDLIFEIQAYLSEQVKEVSPVAYISRGLKVINTDEMAIFSKNNPELAQGFSPVYATPIDEAKRIAELKAENEALKARIKNGVRVDSWENQFGHVMAEQPGFGDTSLGNATLLLDE